MPHGQLHSQIVLLSQHQDGAMQGRSCNHSIWAFLLGLFRSQQNSAVTRMRRSCQVQPSQKNVRSVRFVVKKEGMLLQPLRWRCVECVIHHGRDVREQQQYICDANKQQSDCGVETLSISTCERLNLMTNARGW